MPLDNKISNIIGVKLPQWVFNQLKTRSEKNSQEVRDNDNLLYLTNKTSWIRLVSSVDIKNERDQKYFSDLGVNITGPSSLAKEFVLFGGTSKYLNPTGKQASYELRSGLNGSYGILGKTEIQKYGYRPMPGITGVTIDTQGRLGSIRQATVNFKCWDKAQLDVIDALYFKLGFTMFLEWGHTYYYPSQNPTGNLQTVDPNKVKSTELFSIDPFEEGLSKEEILKRISRNCRDTEGNYDAMLGMVTNFNFTYNQEGGYDCTLRIMGLGVLGDSIKINNPSNLSNILEEQIKQYNNILEEIEKSKNRGSQPQLLSIPPPDLINTLSEIKNPQRNYSYDSKTPEKTELANATIQTDLYGQLFVLKRLNGLIPLKEDLLSNVNVKLDGLEIYKIFSESNKIFSNQNNWKENFDVSIGFNSVLSTLSNELITSPLKFLSNALNITEYVKLSQQAALKNSGYIIEQKYKNSAINKFNYSISIERNLFAKTDSSDAKIQYYPITSSEFYDNFGPYVNSNSIKIKKADILDVGLDGKNGIRLRFEFTIPFTKKVEVKTGEKVRLDKSGKDPIYEIKDVQYNLPISITTDDTALIKSFLAPDITQPADFLSEEKLRQQDQLEQAKKEQQTEPQTPPSEATDSPLKSLSNLELILRTIQVHSLVKAIIKSNNDLEIGRQVVKIDLWDPKEVTQGKSFIEQIFSQGVFSDFILDLINNNISDKDYDTLNNVNRKDALKIQSKYGFASNLMANKEKLYELTDFTPPYQSQAIKIPNRNFQPIDFQQLLTAYVVPYKIDQQIEQGTPLNHPVYIPFGQLLMFLNSNCTIYDTVDQKLQLPLVYIDFNPNHNFCLSNTQQLSTDPFTALIPFEGDDQSFTALFNKDVLTKDKTAIQPLSGSKDSTPLFQPRQGGELNSDALSGTIPAFKYSGGNTFNPYRGRVMNILLNIDYLMQVIKQFSLKDGENKVYLKPLLEQILSDINKSLGNFNIFRLSYNDTGNVFQITDDQVIPVDQRETQLETTSLGTSLPLFGRDSIAKSLEIKSEISSKLANMIAISANASVPSKSDLSTDGTPFGFINYDLVDRYIPNRKSISSSANTDTDKKSAIQFNAAIKSFYGSIAPAKDQVGFATNYYIEKMNGIKGNDSASRAAAMIPVSVNFTTDGISGLGMGQAFTIPQELLPYTYSSRPGIDGNSDINKIGFVVVGLNHSIENNTWNTAVRANMIFLKDTKDYLQQGKPEYKNNKFTGPPEEASDSDVNINTISNYPIISSNYSNINFRNIGLGDPSKDRINETLLGDINLAASRAGVNVSITTAVSGHTSQPSRHDYGNAVDIAIVNDTAVKDKSKIEAKVLAFVNQLAANGYKINQRESGNPKVVLTYGFPNHDNHIHVSFNPNIA